MQFPRPPPARWSAQLPWAESALLCWLARSHLLLRRSAPEVSVLSPQEAVAEQWVGGMWPREEEWPSALCMFVLNFPSRVSGAPRITKIAFPTFISVANQLLGWEQISVKLSTLVTESLLPITASCSWYLVAGSHSSHFCSQRLFCPAGQLLPSLTDLLRDTHVPPVHRAWDFPRDLLGLYFQILPAPRLQAARSAQPYPNSAVMGASAKILTSIPATRESFMAAVSLHPNKSAYFSLVPRGVSLPFPVCYGGSWTEKALSSWALGQRWRSDGCHLAWGAGASVD